MKRLAFFLVVVVELVLVCTGLCFDWVMPFLLMSLCLMSGSPLFSLCLLVSLVSDFAAVPVSEISSFSVLVTR